MFIWNHLQTFQNIGFKHGFQTKLACCTYSIQLTECYKHKQLKCLRRKNNFGSVNKHTKWPSSLKDKPSAHTHAHTPISAQGSRVWNASLQSLLLLIWFIIYRLSSPPSAPGGVCGWRWGQREWYKNNWRTELRLSSLQSGKMAAGDNVLMHAAVAAPIHAF